MHTGMKVLRRVLELLGYVDTYGSADTVQDAELLRRALTAINQITAELWFQEQGEAAFTPITSLQQTIPLSDRACHTVLPYGVAMLLAQNEGDGDRQALYASLYNARRSTVGTTVTRRVDTLPRGWDM